MKDWSVNISINKQYHSQVEADTKKEAIQKALEEWEDLAMVDEDDLDIHAVEVYDYWYEIDEGY